LSLDFYLFIIIIFILIVLIYLLHTATHYWQFKETELMIYEYQRISKSKDKKIELDFDDLSIYKDK